MWLYLLGYQIRNVSIRDSPDPNPHFFPSLDTFKTLNYGLQRPELPLIPLTLKAANFFPIPLPKAAQHTPDEKKVARKNRLVASPGASRSQFPSVPDFSPPMHSLFSPLVPSTAHVPCTYMYNATRTKPQGRSIFSPRAKRPIRWIGVTPKALPLSRRICSSPPSNRITAHSRLWLGLPATSYGRACFGSGINDYTWLCYSPVAIKRTHLLFFVCSFFLSSLSLAPSYVLALPLLASLSVI